MLRCPDYIMCMYAAIFETARASSLPHDGTLLGRLQDAEVPTGIIAAACFCKSAQLNACSIGRCFGARPVNITPATHESSFCMTTLLWSCEYIWLVQISAPWNWPGGILLLWVCFWTGNAPSGWLVSTGAPDCKSSQRFTGKTACQISAMLVNPSLWALCWTPVPSFSWLSRKNHWQATVVLPLVGLNSQLIATLCCCF